MARLKTKREQREYIGPRARVLAQSGNFSGWHEVERHLIHEELCPEARQLLDDPSIRDELDRLCTEAKAQL